MSKERNLRVLRVGLAQIKSTLGEFVGNTVKIIDISDRAQALGVDLLCFPEMAISSRPGVVLERGLRAAHTWQ